MTAPTLVWLRQDLRIGDNPALQAAIERGGPVVPVFIWSPEEEGSWSPGAASRWWLHHSLAALDDALRSLGSRLVLRRGSALAALLELQRETGARAVTWNRRYEPLIVQRDRGVERGLREEGIESRAFNGGILFEPWEICNRAGEPFKVFTAFWRHCLARRVPESSAPAPAVLAPPAAADFPASVPLAELQLLPPTPWTAGLEKAWTPGEAGAQAALDEFVSARLIGYSNAREQPDRIGTSRLSPHLHFGEISPRRVWHTLHEWAERRSAGGALRASEDYLREIGWREFAHHVLAHFPHTTEKPMRSEFASFPWDRRPRELRAWQRGETGYPLVDAGMRELWATGWMHNRVRMVAASFLVKDLRVHWLEGARWFWDTLVDADLANNTLNWQWSAGCGVDAAPYFRIFNPVLQGEKFDPEGDYIRRWVPELAALPKRWIQRPFEAPEEVLSRAAVRLGKDYPRPVVDHGEARARALAALQGLPPDEGEEEG